MPLFAYKGLDGRGKEVKGVLDAEGHRELRSALKRKGIYLSEYREAEKGKKRGRVRRADASAEGQQGGLLSREVHFGDMFKRVKLLDVAEATRHLATLNRAGVPIVESLAAVIDQITCEKLKTVLSEIRRNVMEGASLGDSLEQHPRVFTRLFVNMVRAGESSGTLDTVLTRLAEFIEGQVRMRSKVVAALTYPAVMLLVGIGVIVLLMIVVIPKMVEMLLQMGVELPLPTRILIGISDVFVGYWWLIFAAVGFGVFYFLRWKRSPKGRARWDRFTLRAPVFGRLLREIAIARFCRTLGTLLHSGVPLLTSLEIVKAILDNDVLEKVVERAQNEVREGQSLAVPLRQSEEFPPMVTQMIAMGEESGQLEEMLNNAAEAYEVQVDSRLQTLTAVLEPVMILFMGGFVGGMMASILMPMLKMNQAFQNMK